MARKRRSQDAQSARQRRRRTKCSANLFRFLAVDTLLQIVRTSGEEDLPRLVYVCTSFRDIIKNHVGRPRCLLMTAQSAAFEGCLHIVQWHIEHLDLKVYGDSLCDHAAKGGQLKTLIYLRKNGFLWNAMVCCNAAYGGHLELLQWARENKCPWDGRVAQHAADRGHLDILEWVMNDGSSGWERFLFRLKAVEAATRRINIDGNRGSEACLLYLNSLVVS